MIPALLNNLRTGDHMDYADARLVTWLSERVRNHQAEMTGGVDDASVEAFILVAAALCIARSEGSLGLPLSGDTLQAFVSRALEASRVESAARGADDGEPLRNHAADGVRGFLDSLERGRYDAVLGTQADPKPLIKAHNLLAFHRDWFAERTIAEALKTRRDAPDFTLPDLERARILQETLDDHPLSGRDGSHLQLTPRQREALESSLQSRVFVLAGGPGTGKTTWTAAWLRAVLRLPGAHPDRIRLCAPTGRAARRLEESLRATLAGVTHDPRADERDRAAAEMPVTTLHTLLGWRAFEGRFARTPDDPLDADVVLLDEASMADVHLMAALVRALPPHARLVLAGDPGQLPAVEAGAVLAALLPPQGNTEGDKDVGVQKSGPVPSVTLDVSHRATGHVIPLAAAIRAGRADAVLDLLGPAVEPAQTFAPDRAVTRAATDDARARLEGSGRAEEELEAILQAYAHAAFETVPTDERKGEPSTTSASYATLLERFRTLPREEETDAVPALWKLAGRVRILTPLRQGAVSAESANRLLRRRLEPLWRHRTDGRDPGGFHGAPILITRNDARTGLSNGDLGLWLETADGAAVLFPRPDLTGGWLRIPAALLPSYELGFASTVHKSQGSECDEVLVLLPPADNRLLVRETLYTAVTRARRAVRIYGSEEAIRQAVERRLERFGGLREMMSDQ